MNFANRQRRWITSTPSMTDCRSEPSGCAHVEGASFPLLSGCDPEVKSPECRTDRPKRATRQSKESSITDDPQPARNRGRPHYHHYHLPLSRFGPWDPWGPSRTTLDWGEGGPGGWVILDEPELHFVWNQLVLVPDLGGWKAERLAGMDPDAHRFEVIPD